MMNDLPDIDDFFDGGNNTSHSDAKIANSKNDIIIYISKGDGKWIKVEFLDIAIAGIGIHVLLPVFMEFNSAELKNTKIKFEKKIGDDVVILKESPVLVRWQEKDLATGKLKLGIHFHGELKKDQVILDVIQELTYGKKTRGEKSRL